MSRNIRFTRAARIDDNQRAIIKALEAVGATVQSLASVGRGCPDLLVGFRSQKFLFEVKDGNKPPSRRALTPDEEAWHGWWQGGVVEVITSPKQALIAIGATGPNYVSALMALEEK